MIIVCWWWCAVKTGNNPCQWFSGYRKVLGLFFVLIA